MPSDQLAEFAFNKKNNKTREDAEKRYRKINGQR